MKRPDQIKALLPYKAPFLFVDELHEVNEKGATGTYRFNESSDFYRGHFPGKPITPGVLLIETMAQIGLVATGIFLLDDDFNKESSIYMTSSNIEFLKPVLPNETVTVKSAVVYFRFGKLKCAVSMADSSGATVCEGTISGIIKPSA